MRDLQGRVTQQVRANGSSSSVTYETTTSRVKKVTDAKLQDVLYEYFLDEASARELRQRGLPPAPFEFTYDATYPRVSTKTDEQGADRRRLQSHHRAARPRSRPDRVDRRPLSNDTITLGYDQLGRVVSRAINGVAESVAFDTLGRLEAVTNPLGTFNYSYVGVTERLQSLSYPERPDDGAVLLRRHGRPPPPADPAQEARRGAADRHAYTYEPSGNIKTWTQETDVAAAKVYDFEYDRADQLAAATLKTTDPTPAIVKRYVYAYDAAGNRTSSRSTTASHPHRTTT